MDQEQAADSVTEAIIRHCKKPMSSAEKRRGSLHLLDWLGCASAAINSDVARVLLKHMASAAPVSNGPCSVLGHGGVAAERAAFVNGALGNVLEMDDLHRGSILHAGDVVVPAALAAAQDCNASPHRLCEAIVIGYEVAIHIGKAVATGGYTSWYNSGTCGIFGATAAAAHLYALDFDATIHALGHAGMQAAGMWQCRLEPGFGKQLACAHASRAAITAAQLCQYGFPGPRQIIEGELGFLKSFYSHIDPAILSGPEHDGWLIHEVSFKPWPACRHIHPVLEAALWLAATHDRSDYNRIVVTTYKAAAEFCDNPKPASPHEARFSFQHTVGVAMTRGAPCLADFDQKTRDHHDIRMISEMVEIFVDPSLTAAFPERLSGGVALWKDDHLVDEKFVPNALGDPENSLSDAQLRDKFRHNCAYVGVTESQIDQVADAVLSLPEAAELSDLNQAVTQFCEELREKNALTE